MKIDNHQMSFTLSVKEVSVWMASLRQSALSSSVTFYPWDSCPFYKQHKELIRLTGYSSGDHIDIGERLQRKSRTK